MKKIITISSKGLFTDRNFLQARELTIEDFTFTTRRSTPPETIEDFRWTKRLYHTLIGTLKDECVQELNKYEFFKSMRCHDVNEMGESDLYNAISREVDISVGIRLTTDKGGKVKSLANKLERTEIAKVKLEKMIADKEDMVQFIAVELARLNERIVSIVEKNNSDVEKEIRRNLTNRSSLTDIVEVNKNHFDEEETKVIKDFEKNVSSVDESIAYLKATIEELEKAKSKEYIKLSECVYKDELKEIPEDIRKDIEVHYKNNSTFGSPVSIGRRPKTFGE